MRSVFIISLLLLSSFTFSSEVALDSSSKYSAELIYTILKLVQIVGFLIGLIVLIGAFVKLCRAGAENSKTGWMSILVMVLTGALMMNINSALSTFGNTFFDKNGAKEICFIVEENGISDSCFSSELSGLSGQLKDRIEKMSGAKTSELFMSKFKIILGVLQLIGFVYFFTGTYALKQVADGSSKDGGYGKPITVMIASSLIVDLPHTLQNAVNTLEKIGLQF
jgi:hypothetical protein